MSLTLTSLKDVAGSWRRQSSPIIVGKDLLELLSSSMYVDPRSIYREYVQNAADAIDEARAAGHLSATELGRVDIFVDQDNRTARIVDNGTGVGRDQFEQRLTSFGASLKRNTNARGFRGVGRLAGLAYCQELVFRSRAAGESKVSEMSWDCRSIKASLRAEGTDSSLQEIVNAAVNVRHIDGTGWPDHFFEVELRGIVRHKKDVLLNRFAIYDYLSEVAPVPFSPDFRFGEEIVSTLSDHVSLCDLKIQVEGIEDQVYRPHRNELHARGGIHDRFAEIEYCRIPSADGGLGAIGWLLHHGYKGAIPASQISGLRLRSGNIQVGGHDLLVDLFAESRFNSWTVGEIHTFDKRIIPNGRRDHYEQNIHFNNLTNHLTPIARQLSARCRQSSILRNLLHDFHRRETFVREKLQILAQGCLVPASRKKQVREIDELVASMRRITSRNILSADVQKSLKRVVDKLEKETAKTCGNGNIANPLAQLPPRKRKTYEQVFALIYECSNNYASAHALVERILSKLN